MSIFSLFNPIVNAQEGTVTDIDGNVYKTVQIGDQVWMAENLKVTRYNNGEAIPFVTDNRAWATIKTGAFCWFSNEEEWFGNRFGALYNGIAAQRKDICPEGWKVPTWDDWLELRNFAGGIDEAGALKSVSKIWHKPNWEAKDSFGFSALPGGHRESDGKFYNLGLLANWWSTQEGPTKKDYAGFCSVNYINQYINLSFSEMQSGRGIRCLKND